MCPDNFNKIADPSDPTQMRVQTNFNFISDQEKYYDVLMTKSLIMRTRKQCICMKDDSAGSCQNCNVVSDGNCYKPDMDDMSGIENLFDVYVRHYECYDSTSVNTHVFLTHINLQSANNYDGELLTIQAYEEDLDSSNYQDKLKNGCPETNLLRPSVCLKEKIFLLFS